MSVFRFGFIWCLLLRLNLCPLGSRSGAGFPSVQHVRSGGHGVDVSHHWWWPSGWSGVLLVSPWPGYHLSICNEQASYWEGVCKHHSYPPQAFASRFWHPVKDLACEDFYCDAGLVVISCFSHSPWAPSHGYADISGQSSCTWRLSSGWSPKLPPALALGIPSPLLTCDLSWWQFGLDNQTLKATPKMKGYKSDVMPVRGAGGKQKAGCWVNPRMLIPPPPAFKCFWDANEMR